MKIVNTYDDEILLAWFKSYLAEKGEDQHSKFARRIGVSRPYAKHLCYKIAYTIHKAEVMGTYRSWPSIKSKHRAPNQDNIIVGNNAQE